MLCKSIFTAAALALVLPIASADTIGAGFGADHVTTLSALTTYAAYDTLSNGNRVVYDGSQVWIENDAGTVLQVLGNPSTPSFADFIEVDPTETFAVLGESNHGNLYKVSLATGGPTFLATIPFNYDLAYLNGNTAYVSAASTSFSFNDLYSLDLTSGATTLLANASGPSGPLAISAAGDLYYATQSNAFPTPPGAVSIIRWTAAQLAGVLPLTQGDATVFTSNLDGAASMVFDPAFGNLFLSESVYLGASSVVEIDHAGQVIGRAAVSLDTLGKIEIFDTPGDGACAAYQPAGRELKFRTTDFNNGLSRVTTISPRRPTLTSVQNDDGTMTLTVAGGLPNGTSFLILGNLSQYSPIESYYDFGGYRFWTGMTVSALRRTQIYVGLDGTGTGSYTFNNTPSIQGLFALQALAIDGSGVFRGSSTTAFN